MKDRQNRMKRFSLGRLGVENPVRWRGWFRVSMYVCVHVCVCVCVRELVRALVLCHVWIPTDGRVL